MKHYFLNTSCTLFIAFITCVVLINCIFMTLNKPPENYQIAEYIFTVIYTVEFAVKIVARGFVLNEFTYLRDPWNVLDLFVLIMTYAALALPFSSISAIRIFRVLRTLKAVSVIPGLKVIIASLLQSVKKLANVMLLTVFCLAVFALVGLQLFMGNLKYKCVHASYLNNSIIKEESCTLKDSEVYQKKNSSTDVLLCGYTSHPNETECKNGTYYCVKHGENPDDGYTSFDHFGWAFLSLFRLMTQDSWEILYRQVIRTSGKSYCIFFVIIIFLCSFYLFNLILAVVTMAYEEQNKATLAHTKAREMLLREAKELLKKEKELASQRQIASLDENTEMSSVEFKNKKLRKSKRKKKTKDKEPKTYGEDETLFYTPPDKSQKELKELLMSYHLPVDTPDDPFQRQRLTSAANVISKTMEWEESKLEFPPCLKTAAHKYLIWQCCPLWLQIKKMVKKVMINPFAELFITLCIIVNTVLMTFERVPETKNMVSTGNKVFTAIFTAEMVLKIIALDPYYYFQEAWNIFDCLLAVLGIISLVTRRPLSIFRMLRIFKLSKFWPALNKLMKIMWKSVGPLSNLTLVLIFTVFIFAVVGKQGFSQSYKTFRERCENQTQICNSDSTDATHKCKLRWHMEDFLHSFLVIFRILCGEWIETMWGCMKAAGEGWCIFLFMLVLLLGNLVVLNLFIALLLSSFSSSDSETEVDEEQAKPHVILAHRGLQFVKHLLWNRCCNALVQKLKKARTKTKEVTIPKDGGTEPRKGVQENYASGKHLEKLPVDHFMTDFNTFVCAPLAEMETFGEEEIDCSKEENNLQKRREKFKRSRQMLSSDISKSTNVWSLNVPKSMDLESSCSEASTVDERSPICIFPVVKKEPVACFPQVLVKFFPCCTVNTDKFPGNTWWRFRKTCYRIVKHSWFESFIIFMILLSSGVLIFEDIYLAERKTIKIILEYADIFFFYIFFLEMLLKWVAYGFRKYFTNAWCWLDFFIVCVSFPAKTVGTKGRDLCDSHISTKSLRTLRALRPLRALSRFKGIKVVVNALAGAVPSIGNVLLVCVVLWLPFNILGVQLFGGKFSKCSNASLKNKNVCESQNSKWSNTNVNFDHVGMGYLALLQVATFKGWMEIMYAAVDAPSKENEDPSFENNVWAYLYFVAFIIFGSFFMLNLFIGVVIDNFNQQRKKISGELIFMSDEQKKYYNALKKLGNKKPLKPVPRPQNMYQGLLFDIVNKKAFDIFIISLILLNVVIMAAEHEDEGEAVKSLLENINLVFVAIFTGECIIKMLALRLYFFKDGWNIFDFVVVILSILSSAAGQLRKAIDFPPTILRIIRVARVSRLLRLIRGARGLRTLLFALLMSLPSLTNIGLLLFLIMFIYAIFGMSNFACASWQGGIDNIFNFQTFGSSMLCLFQITTSAGWHDLLNPMLNTENITCAPNLGGNGPCVNRSVAIAYFVSYIIISFLIVVNMYIAVIIENLNVATEESTEPLGDDDFEIFYEIWAKFDPRATQFISYFALSDFADALAEPLRIPKPNRQQLMLMDLPMVNGNKIHCLDILFAFTKRVLGEYGDMGPLETQIEEKYPEKIANEPIITTPKRKEEESAAIIQRAFRMYLLHQAAKEVCQETCNSPPLERIHEEEGGFAVTLSENEDSQSSNSHSPSPVSIPPSYSNVTGTTNDIIQVTITDTSEPK
ncbi:sodium channel protein type 5 subunit alpha-like [Podarcis raffonei]|uniref:sodium channel protein type 5 subunit alpha-like n=1 Tax=Podarcis raffonei TaxID=65483 RepID=UPI002329696C|nr:sodium channel protein type 5 subunit alpha-like [Podarcis raffonei]